MRSRIRSRSPTFRTLPSCAADGTSRPFDTEDIMTDPTIDPALRSWVPADRAPADIRHGLVTSHPNLDN